jgi:hypothetical protein
VRLVLPLALAACSPLPTFTARAWPTRFQSVVVREVELSLAPGGPPSGIWLLPGFPVPSTVAAWIPVHLARPVSIAGWIPSSARGVRFTDRPDRAQVTSPADQAFVYAAPSLDAPIVAGFDNRIPGLVGVPGTWAAVQLEMAHVRITGWALVPDPPPRKVTTFDFDDDVIEGELVKPEGVID